jgi:hypothetical protein
MRRIKNELVEIGRSESDWSILYLDKSDGRYWELNYPISSQLGVGAPNLEQRSLEEVAEKYKVHVPG